MAETYPTPRRSRWPLILGGLFLLLVILYFVISSGPFVRAVVLPMAEKKLQSELTVEDISFSPFSSLRLRGVKIVPKGAAPLLTVGELRIRYGLISILTGKIRVDEVLVDSPNLTVVQQPGAPSNLDVLVKTMGSGPARTSSGQSAAPELRIENVALRNGSLSARYTSTNGTSVALSVSGLEFSIDALANGGASKIKLGWAGEVVHSVSGSMDFGGAGEWDVALDPALKPTTVKGQLMVDVKRGDKLFQVAQGLSAVLGVEAGASELKRLELAFRRGTNGFGKMVFSGPFDLKKNEARISYDISGIGREVNGVIGGLMGIDLGDSSFSASGRVDLAQFGNLLASNGRLDYAHFTVRTPGGVTPEIDAGLDYKVSFNFSESTALMEKVSLTLVQGGKTLLRGNFDRPMNIALKGRGPGFRQATYQFVIDSLDLGPWKPILAQSVPGIRLDGGVVKLDASITSENDGSSLKVEFTTAVSQLAITSPAASFDDGLLKANLSAVWSDFTTLQVDKFGIELAHHGVKVSSLTGSAHYQTVTKEFGFQLGGDSDLVALLQIVPVKGLALGSGTSTLSVQLTQRKEGIEGSIGLSLNKLSGKADTVGLTNYSIRMDGTGKLSKTSLTVNRVAIALQNGFENGGSLDFNGGYDLDSKRGKLTYKSVNLNQVGLGPWVAGIFAPNRLVSVGLDINGDASVELIKGASGQAESGLKSYSVRADLAVNNLRVDDTAHRLPDKPFSLGAALDVSQTNSVIDLRKLNLRLGATSRARNELALVGRLDLSATNSGPSSLSMKSDGLDLTSLYLLFSQSSGETNRFVAKSTAPQRDPSIEPPAIALPIQRLDVDVNLAHVFLGEISIADWAAKVKVDRGVVSVDPFGLSFNGAPVSARALLDVSVPGFKYDIRFDGSRLPIAPVVNTLQPTLAGTVGGTVQASAAIKGAGVTGLGLQKNLEGQFDFGATNLNLKIKNVQSGFLKGILNVVIGLPELISSPSSALARLGQMTGISTNKTDSVRADGWIDQLQAEPLQLLNVKGTVGSGKVNISDALVQSAVLRIRAPGTMTLLPILTNSTLDFPVDIGLKESLAKKVGLTGAPGDYTSLPQGCLTVRGTMGKPEPKPDTTKLVMLGGKAILGVAGNTASAIGNLIGQATGSTNQTSTNALGNAIKGLEGLFGTGAPKGSETPKKN